MKELWTEVHKLAGLLEGEGCFARNGNSSRGWTPEIVLTTTDRDVAEWAASLLDANICDRPAYRGRKPSYQVFLYSDRAAQWMMILYPFMISQRRKAKIVELLTARLHQVRGTHENN